MAFDFSHYLSNLKNFLEEICNVAKSQLNFPQFLLEVLKTSCYKFLSSCSVLRVAIIEIIHWKRTGSQEVKTGG
jgi:hypothetical protein